MIFSCALRYAARRPAAQGRGIFLGLPGTCSSARVARLVGRAGLLSYVPGGTWVFQRTGVPHILLHVASLCWSSKAVSELPRLREKPSGAKAQQLIAEHRRHECLIHPVMGLH
jgi:hypothetical protein